MPHPFPGRSRAASDESGHRFRDMLFHKRSRLFFRVAANFAHHQDGFRLRIRFESPHQIDERRTNDWVPAESDASRLSQSEIARLPNSFISQRPAPAHDSDAAF